MIPSLFSYSQLYTHVSTSKGLTLVLDSTDFSYIVFPAEFILGSSFFLSYKMSSIILFNLQELLWQSSKMPSAKRSFKKASCFKIIAECMRKCKEPQKEVLCVLHFPCSVPLDPTLSLISCATADPLGWPLSTVAPIPRRCNKQMLVEFCSCTC